jgi:hypothetical protein
VPVLAASTLDRKVSKLEVSILRGLTLYIFNIKPPIFLLTMVPGLTLFYLLCRVMVTPTTVLIISMWEKLLAR